MSAHDISRFLYRPRRHYSGVRMQQGRLLLDSDFNESTALHDADRRHALIDLLGPGASPNQGFSIGNTFTGAPPASLEFLGLGDEVPWQEILNNGAVAGAGFRVRAVGVQRGSFYLGGQRLDLEVPEPFPFQSDFLQFGAEDSNPLDTGAEFRHFYYLHAWEQVVGAAEDDEIREVALGGEDTSVRVRRMRRVEILPLSSPLSPRRAWLRLRRQLFLDHADVDLNTGEARSRGRLQIKLREIDDTQICRTCKPDQNARYLGANNLTLRVMLTSPTTFVWALDNGAPLYRASVAGLQFTDEQLATEGNDLTVTLLNPPEDEAQFPLVGRVVEIIPFGSVLPSSEPEDGGDPHFGKLAAPIGVFTRIVEPYDPNTRRFKIDKTVAVEALRKLVYEWDEAHPFEERLNVSSPELRHFYLRVWHEAPTPEQIELPIIEHPFPEPPGAKLSFDEDDPKTTLGNLEVRAIFRRRGRRGDYWTVALRPEAPEPVVPFDLEWDRKREGAAPHGPRHFYAPIAVVAGSKESSSPDAPALVTEHTDSRQRIRPLSDRGCITFSVGDGISSYGDFTSIQEAILALPEAGGHIAVRAGVYRERLELAGRSGVVLEGCGEATILESPLDPEIPNPANQPPLIDIRDQSRSITISGFHLRAVEHDAIRISEESSNVTLANLTAVAGVRVRERVVRGALMPQVSQRSPRLTSEQRRTLSQRPLISVVTASDISIRGVAIEPDTRPGLAIVDSSDVIVAELTGVGTAQSRVSPAIGTAFDVGAGEGAAIHVVPVTGLVTISNSKHVTVRDSLLSAFGQPGIVVNAVASLRSMDVQIVGVSVIANRHRSIRSGRITPSQSGVNVDGGTRIRFEDSSVVMDDTPSEHAGVVVRGTDLLVRGNRVEALTRCFDARPPRNPASCRDRRPLAFGGIQIRGGSLRVQIRDNDVAGGIGHGITLGSVYWRGRSGIRREGAGRGQIKQLPDDSRVVTGVIAKSIKEGGLVYLSEDEGSLREVVVADNRIEQMFGNGISVLSVLGMPKGLLIDIDRVRIERNTIVGNLLRPGDTIPSRAEVLPFSDSLTPGGVLIAALPLGGIVLGTVTGTAQILGNVVVNNGTSRVQPHNGIFILNGDGIVIAENRVTGNGGRASPDTALRPGIRAGIAVMLAGTGAANKESNLAEIVRSPTRQAQLLEERARSADPLQNDGCSLRLYNNVVLHPEGRALYAVATGPVAMDGNSFASQGNHGSNTLSDMFAVGDVVFVMNVGPPWEDHAIPENAFTTYDTPPGTEEYLTTQPPPVEGGAAGADPDDEDKRDEDVRYSVGDGGGVLFNNNQVTYDWSIQRLPVLRVGAPVSYFPVALISLDHVGIEGNQFAFRLAGLTARSRFVVPVKGTPEPVLSNVFTLGGTVQVGANRMSETIGTTVLSMLAIAELMLSSTYNQSTHQVFLTTSDALSATGSVEVPDDDDSPVNPRSIPLQNPPSVSPPPEFPPRFFVRGTQVMFTSKVMSAASPTGSLPKSLRKISKRFLELLLDR